MTSINKTLLVLILLFAPSLDFAFSLNQGAGLVIGFKTFTQRNPNASDALADTLDAPQKIFSDGSHLYVADTANNRVLIYNTLPASLNIPADEVLGQCDPEYGGGGQ